MTVDAKFYGVPAGVVRNASMSASAKGMRGYFTLVRAEENGLLLFKDPEKSVPIARYEGEPFWQNLPVGSAAAFVSGIQLEDHQVSFNLADVSEEIAGGLDFDIDFLPVQPADALNLSEVGGSGISGQVSITVAKLLADAQGHFQASWHEGDEFLNEELRESFLWNLEQITKENGYRVNIKGVRDDFVTVDELRNLTGLAVLWGDAKTVSESNDYTIMEQDVLIVGVLEEADRQKLMRLCSQHIASIETRIANNYGLINKAGKQTCQFAQCRFKRSWGNIGNSPKGGFKIGYRMQYEYRSQDPTIL